MQRRRDPAPVQQQHRLAVRLEHPPELSEQRRRQRIPRLAAHIDDPNRRQIGADPPSQLEPLERRPALRARRRGAEHGDGPFQRGALDRNRPGVVPRIRVLLVRRLVLLVDHDQPEPVHRREHG